MSTHEAMNWILAHDCDLSIDVGNEISLVCGTEAAGWMHFAEPYGDPGPSLIRLVQRAREWMESLRAAAPIGA